MAKPPYKKPEKDGNQKGLFVGQPDAVHIHIVSNQSHVKIGKGTGGGSRSPNFDIDDQTGRQGAIDWLKSKCTGKVGYKECYDYLHALCLAEKKKEAAAKKT